MMTYGHIVEIVYAIFLANAVFLILTPISEKTEKRLDIAFLLFIGEILLLVTLKVIYWSHTCGGINGH